MLPVFRRFTVSDIPAAPNWISSIFSPLNIFCEQTVQTLNKNLVIGENVQGAKFTTSFTTPSDYATGGFTRITFNYTGGGQPTCLLIGAIQRADGVLLTTSPMPTKWSMNINTNPSQVTIDYISGLTASTKYSVVFLAL